VAPGARIIAALPLALGKGAYFTADCTSYAVPHVTGVLALLKQACPETTAGDLKRAIMAGCEPAKPSFLSRTVGRAGLGKRLTTRLRLELASHGDPRWSVGSGRINALRSYEELRKSEQKSSS
jgi:hypothetical protein